MLVIGLVDGALHFIGVGERKAAAAMRLPALPTVVLCGITATMNQERTIT